ncbi:hypothetical protein [Pseudomonas monteilii]
MLILELLGSLEWSALAAGGSAEPTGIVVMWSRFVVKTIKNY